VDILTVLTFEPVQHNRSYVYLLSNKRIGEFSGSKERVCLRVHVIFSNWQYVALAVVLWHPALLASSLSLAASVTALR